MRLTEEQYAAMMKKRDWVRPSTLGNVIESIQRDMVEGFKPAPKKRKAPAAPNPTLSKLLTQLDALGLAAPAREWRFHAERRWRFDIAWPGKMLAVELDGMVYGSGAGGRHQRPAGYTEDCRKIGEAMRLGWRVLCVTPTMIREGDAATLIEALLSSAQA